MRGEAAGGGALMAFTGAGAAEANPWLARKMRAPYDYGFVS